MNQPNDPAPIVEANQDPLFLAQVQRLHQLTVYGRWLFAGALWLTVGTLSLWGLRYPISLAMEYFTWAALRYGLVFSPIPGFGLSLCLAVTLSILVWQLRNWLLGLPKRECRRLEQQVLRIRQQGSSHPLWKWVCLNDE
ncbi:hypothetical protein JOY44_08470 [Phormidium sp. CLA17]|uniref:hypothetical protein n=1 Tax=Leptolyngbya sp. Cla-17 TaxID=2803751 RepID=UPI001490DFF6|nr:hypothetical protein [Leptolyngbya sp. Cla-17]MBM0741649.1 hypothetical protein [Leptolyngbya sp. Cla-17]